MKTVSRKMSILKDKCWNLFLSNSKHDFRFYEIMIMGSLAYLMTKMSYGYLTKYTHFQACKCSSIVSHWLQTAMSWCINEAA